MKVKVLVDSNQAVKNMPKRSSVSYYIETGNRKVLFDLGSNSTFANNGKKLSVDISKIDTAVLSSGFADLGGGLKTFTQLNDMAKIYVQQDAFTPHYTTKMGMKFLCGLDPELSQNPKIVFTNNLYFVDDSIQLVSNMIGQKYTLKTNMKYYLKDSGGYFEDTFKHEQYMLIQEDSKNFLFVGNTNLGVANVIHKVESITNSKIHYVFGGFHLLEEALKYEENAQQINEGMKDLKSGNCHFYVSKLNGKEALKELDANLSSQITYFTQGEEITI